jgi:hypothetical protein
MYVCVCVCVFTIEIQTNGSISMKFGMFEYHDPGTVFVYVWKQTGLMLASWDQKTSLGQTMHFTENVIEQKL